MNVSSVEQIRRKRRARLKGMAKPTAAAEHFLSSPNHTANDMQLIPIGKISKAKEAFLISKGRTLVPHGFNIREEIY